MTPPLYYSCHQLLSSLPPFHCFSALFLSRSLMLSLNHPFLSVSFPIHLPQSSSSILLCILTNLPHYPSEHFLCPLSPSLHIPLPLYPPPPPASLFPLRAFGVVMMHSATMFISASFPEWLCLYLNIRNTFFFLGSAVAKKILFRMSKACSFCLPVPLACPTMV